ncbi:MAG TPA: HU family DNA-binding protein [Phytomonospora sp.]
MRAESAPLRGIRPPRHRRKTFAETPCGHCGRRHRSLAFVGVRRARARHRRFIEGKTVNKSQLIDTLSARFDGNRKAAAHALESVLDTITREVAKGNKVAITGFGSFEKRVRAARMVRNPRTGEQIRAKKTAVPKFTAGADLKNVVSGAKKLPKLTIAAAPAAARKATATGMAAAAAATGAARKSATKSTPGSAAKKSTASKSSTAKSAATKSSPAKKSAAKSNGSRSTASKSTASKSTASKSTASKSTASKSTASKSTTS